MNMKCAEDFPILVLAPMFETLVLKTLVVETK
jgi:hypothetical protein